MKGKRIYRILIPVVCVAVFVCLGFAAHRDAPEDTEPERVYITGALVKRDVDDLFAQAEVIALGTITGQSEAFQIQNVAGTVANFTDYEFTVSQLWKGEPDTEPVTIRLQGGLAGNREEIYEHSPQLLQGQEYLLFLYQPGRGGAYNTEGDYYYILGLTQGTFTPQEDGSFLSAVETVIVPDDLSSAVSALSSEQEESYFRKEYIENQRRNLENAVISQGQYDELMANIDRYAVIVD